MKRLKILVSAFAVSPYRGSEFGVGWNIVTRLASYHDVTVLYGDIGREEKYRLDIEKWIAKHGEIEGLRFVYVPQGKFGNFFSKICRLKPLIFLYYYAYRYWQRQAYHFAKKLLEKEHYDLVHLLTFIGYREPGYLWELPTPFFWGPIAGVVDIPWSFFPLMSWQERLRGLIRNTLNSIQRTGSHSVRKAMCKSSMVWGVGKEDVDFALSKGAMKSKLIPVTGTYPFLNAYVRSKNINEPLRMVWSGLHQGIKALPILLNAWSRLEDPSGYRLIIMGSGVETKKWRKLASILGLDQWIEWTGMLPLDEAVKKMNCGDIFVFTGIKEGTPTVIMEALSMGLPVICHDSCGMTAVVNESCGIKIPMINPSTSIVTFAKAIQRIGDDPDLLKTLSYGALERSRELSWDEKVKTIAETYAKVIG